MTKQLSLFELSKTDASETKAQKGVNVASVPLRSPFRYPGGKTWLVPTARLWLQACGGEGKVLFDVFAGGGIVGLTAIFENLVDHLILVELDDDVAAVWQVILSGDAGWLVDRILSFEMTVENARGAIAAADSSLRARAFATIVKNRVNRGGILADGASFVRHGENGKGIRSRWYPTTLRRRILAIDHIRERITFVHGDAFAVCRHHAHDPHALFFIDPPYVKAGRRLYRHSEIDHPALFAQASALKGDFMMTYDDHPEIRQLAATHDLQVGEISMKTTHHAQKRELLISRDLDWLTS